MLRKPRDIISIERRLQFYGFENMSSQLTESQVARVVAEVSRQAQLRELDERERLDRGQVVQILEELKLPVELLDPAMRELERREAEAKRKRAMTKRLQARSGGDFGSSGQASPRYSSLFYSSASSSSVSVEPSPASQPLNRDASRARRTMAAVSAR